MTQDVAAGASAGSPEKVSALPQKELWNKEGDSYLAHGLMLDHKKKFQVFPT